MIIAYTQIDGGPYGHIPEVISYPLTQYNEITRQLDRKKIITHIHSSASTHNQLPLLE